MKERPILFSAPMVRALLAGTKTQTRRVVKPLKGEEIDPAGIYDQHPGDLELARCPYGQPGDRLWVREAYFGNHYLHPNEPADERELHYRADGYEDFEGERITWRPSIHMPRWASRITLEIVSVRVERLHEISEEDAKAEGVEHYKPEHTVGLPPCSAHRYAFEDLWRSINGHESWSANPWVWVVEFKRWGV